MDSNRDCDILKSVYTERNFSFAENTTYGCGGTAEIAYFPESSGQAAAVYDRLNAEGYSLAILGNGSNVLAADGYFKGVVISTKRLKGVVRTGADTVFCRAGTNAFSLLKYCTANGLSGVEFIAGIPATCGGLAFMNGGADGKFIGDRILSVKFYNGKMHNFSNKYCKFGHKYSIMRDINGIILGITLKLQLSDSKTVSENIAYFLKKRSAQPKGKSCGCVFKNSGGVSAGKIIDAAGLKGLSIGGAAVSYDHANFIINTGKSASDVYALIREVRRRVYESTGISLDEEVVYIGDFNDTYG